MAPVGMGILSRLGSAATRLFVNTKPPLSAGAAPDYCSVPAPGWLPTRRLGSTLIGTGPAAAQTSSQLVPFKGRFSQPKVHSWRILHAEEPVGPLNRMPGSPAHTLLERSGRGLIARSVGIACVVTFSVADTAAPANGLMAEIAALKASPL